jgi:hypothetical protein
VSNNLDKVLLIGQTYRPANKPRSFRLINLAIGLEDHFDEVHVACFTNNDWFDNKKTKVFSLGKSTFLYENSNGIVKRSLNSKLLIFGLSKFVSIQELYVAFRVFLFLIKSKINYSLIITVAQPHGINWGVAVYKYLTKNKTTWLADCGDPFYFNPFLKIRYPYFTRVIEKYWCRIVNEIFVPFEKAKEGYFFEFRDKIHSLPQGYYFDLGNYKSLYAKNNIIKFAYAGAFYKGFRDPNKFIGHLLSSNENFEFVIYTDSRTVINQQYLFDPRIKVCRIIPRDELLIELAKMDFLVYFENNNEVQLGSKLIDYGIASRPVLRIGLDVDCKVLSRVLKYDFSDCILVDPAEFDNNKIIEKLINIYENSIFR